MCLQRLPAVLSFLLVSPTLSQTHFTLPVSSVKQTFACSVAITAMGGVLSHTKARPGLQPHLNYNGLRLDVCSVLVRQLEASIGGCIAGKISYLMTSFVTLEDVAPRMCLPQELDIKGGLLAAGLLPVRHTACFNTCFLPVHVACLVRGLPLPHRPMMLWRSLQSHGN